MKTGTAIFEAVPTTVDPPRYGLDLVSVGRCI
jgi:hypothetical protein